MWWFGKGKVELQLQKYGFIPGEVIQGSVVFKLKKVLHARAVNIRLAGIRHSSSYNAGKGMSRSNKDYVFDLVQPLDREKDYSGEFSYNVGKINCTIYGADRCEQLSDFSEHPKNSQTTLKYVVNSPEFF